MNDDIDLDIKNYTSKDLYDLCNLENNASAKEIVERIDFFITKYRDDERLTDFFVQVQYKLLSSESFTMMDNANINEENEISDHDNNNDNNIDDSDDNDNDIDDGDDNDNDIDDGDDDGDDEQELFTTTMDQNEDDEQPELITSTMDDNDDTDKPSYINNQNNSSGGWLTSNFGALKQQDPVRPPNVQFAKRDGGNDAMRQNYLGVQQKFEVPYAQGVLNPNTHNKIISLMNIDSKFRPLPDGKFYIYPQLGCSTNYSINMTEKSHNVMSIKLESYEIPYTWLEIDSKKGNDKFSYTNIATSTVSYVDILQGNPPLEDVKAEVDASGVLELKLNASGYVVLKNVVSDNISINFWGDDLKWPSAGAALTVNKQSSLGWLLGFRQESYDVSNGDHITAEAHSYWSNPDGITSSTVVAYSDWKLRHVNSCLYIVLDDNQRNRSNKGVINITPTDTTLNVPSYFSCDICNNEVGTLPTGGVYNNTSKLTRAQLYSLFVIQENRKKNSKSNIATGANDIDILGKVSLGNKSYGEIYMDDNVSDTYKRNYLGPVNLDKFSVRLIDDHGNLVNLSNADWSFSLQVERLYQY